MNPTRFLLIIAITALLSSCTKDILTPENPVVLSESSIELIYPDELTSSTGRVVVLDPPSVSQLCKPNTPSIMIPRILVGDKIEIIYTDIQEFNGNVEPKSINWKVNGETVLQLTSTLELPYVTDEYIIEVIVKLKNGGERMYNFTLNVTHDMPLDSDGYIEYNEEDTCVTGPTVGPSCLPQNGKAGSIIIVDPFS